MGTMKNLFILIVLTATFLFGYHVGRKPDSPDVIGWLSVKSRQAYSVGKDAAVVVSEKYQDVMGDSEASR